MPGDKHARRAHALSLSYTHTQVHTRAHAARTVPGGTCTRTRCGRQGKRKPVGSRAHFYRTV
eukprot:6202795-Pleurochrysis_carterae.AAC.6